MADGATFKNPATDQDRRDELLGMLTGEESQALNYAQNELSSAQIDALKRYFGDPYGDEIENRSSITTREVFEVIEWLRPEFGRMFAGGDRAVEYSGTTAEDDAYAEEASDYINYVFMSDNDGPKLIDGFAFDGLLQRIGIIASEWKEAEYSAWQPASGLNSQQIEQLFNEPETEIKDVKVEHQVPDEAHPDGLFVSCKIRARDKEAKAECFTIAPEDFRCSARAGDNLDEARYTGDVMRIMRADAIECWPEHEDALRAYQGRETTSMTDQRRSERFRDTAGWDVNGESSPKDNGANEIEIYREFVRYDLDGDGYPEMLRCYRIIGTLLEAEEVDEHIYSYWTPIPIPHRLVGLSVADEISDIQRAKTVLLRNLLDAKYQSLVPRIIADKNGTNLDALLNLSPGAIIEVDGNPNDKVMPLVTPDVGDGALSAMQWIDQIAQMRTGVNRIGQGMDPDVLNKMVVKGVQFIQNADSLRKEQYARNFAIGLSHFFGKLYRLVCKHQNEARTVKIAGNWKNIDPRGWTAKMRCTVSTGLGTGAKEAHLAMLQMIQADQMAWVMQYGLQTPVVTPDHLYNTVRQKLRVMGYSSIDPFFAKPQNPDGTPFIPQPQPNPEQMKGQVEQQKIQAQQDTAKMQMQLEATKESSKMQLDSQHIQLQFQHDAAITKMTQDAENQRAALTAQTEQTKAKLDAAKLHHEHVKHQDETVLRHRELDIEERKLALSAATDSAKLKHDGEQKDADRKVVKETAKAKAHEHVA